MLQGSSRSFLCPEQVPIAIGTNLRNKKKSFSFREALVPRTGIEPALPCDNQILSLALFGFIWFDVVLKAFINGV